MHYKNKLLLGILEKFEGVLSHTKLQKVLFLVTRKQNERSFDFVPYKYGGFSFRANQNLITLSKKGVIENRNVMENHHDWILKTDERFFHHLKKEDQIAIGQIQTEISSFTQRELIRYTYLKYPYFATKSLIAAKLLSLEELENINLQKSKYDELAFYTIGYEKTSLEKYLNKLIVNDVRLLCDVRKNAISMKYGFSKNQLKKACENIGITYTHFPELGIDSKKRTNLRSIDDYNRLFENYEKTTLVEHADRIKELFDRAYKYGRIAITCFEKEPHMCHRSRVARLLRQLPTWDIEQKNL